LRGRRSQIDLFDARIALLHEDPVIQYLIPSHPHYITLASGAEWYITWRYVHGRGGSAISCLSNTKARHWIQEYNEERPYESLGMSAPNEHLSIKIQPEIFC